MRCISPNPRYSIQVLEGQEQIVVDARGHATTITHSKPVIADFQQGGLLDHEIEAALENFNFSGIPEGVNPLTRVSFFDSEAYVQRLPASQQDAMLATIDERLRVLADIYPSEFIIVEQPAAGKPWPSYDTDSVKDILRFQERLGISPETIRLYEEQNRNRQPVIEAMLRLENPELAEQTFGPAEPDEEEIEVAA